MTRGTLSNTIYQQVSILLMANKIYSCFREALKKNTNKTLDADKFKIQSQSEIFVVAFNSKYPLHGAHGKIVVT